MNCTVEDGQEMKVFIVEDSAAIMERVADLVREVVGTELVGNAGNFRDAISGILSTRPEVAILDIRLADQTGSGIDVLNHVRVQLPDLKAIMLSNYATPQHIKASAEAGAEYFLDKTVDFERIGEILRQWQDTSKTS